MSFKEPNEIVEFMNNTMDLNIDYELMQMQYDVQKLKEEKALKSLFMLSCTTLLNNLISQQNFNDTFIRIPYEENKETIFYVLEGIIYVPKCFKVFQPIAIKNKKNKCYNDLEIIIGGDEKTAVRGFLTKESVIRPDSKEIECNSRKIFRLIQNRNSEQDRNKKSSFVLELSDTFYVHNMPESVSLNYLLANQEKLSFPHFYNNLTKHDFLMDIRNTWAILKVTPYQNSNLSLEIDESTNTISEDINLIVNDTIAVYTTIKNWSINIFKYSAYTILVIIIIIAIVGLIMYGITLYICFTNKDNVSKNIEVENSKKDIEMVSTEIPTRIVVYDKNNVEIVSTDNV